MKYVMFKRVGPVPTLFSEDLVHSDVAEGMVNGPLKGYKVHSAGFPPSIGIRPLVCDYGGCFA